MDNSEIRSLIEKACELNQVPELALTIRFEFNNRFTRRLGDASYLKRQIRLSGPLWPRATAEEKRHVVIHETCHIIARYKFGGQIKPHGVEWRQCMVKAGEEPKRCHNVDRTGLKRQTSHVSVNCGCDNPPKVTKHLATKMRKGIRYRCRICKQRISLPHLI